MRINIAAPQLGEEEIDAVSRIIKSGLIACGPETKLFEQEFAEFVGSKYACAANNGTAALFLALTACDIGPGDEVITSPFTFIATGNAILSCGAIPVFADIDEKTFNICPKAVGKLITKKTKAIMPVHLYGLPADLTELRKIADSNELFLIGDAAQAHGAAIGEVLVGGQSDIECFSFYPTKNMTTGEGGMATTNDPGLHEMLNSIRNHGRPDSQLGVYTHDRFGLNLRLTDIGAAIGRVQLKKLPTFNRIRARNAKLFDELLCDVEGINLPKSPKGFTHVWHQYTIRVKKRFDLVRYLKKADIGCGIYYPKLIQDYPHLQQFKGECPVAEKVVTEVLSLPVHAGLSEEDITFVANKVISWSKMQN